MWCASARTLCPYDVPPAGGPACCGYNIFCLHDCADVLTRKQAYLLYSALTVASARTAAAVDWAAQ